MILTDEMSNKEPQNKKKKKKRGDSVREHFDRIGASPLLYHFCALLCVLLSLKHDGFYCNKNDDDNKYKLPV